MGDSLTPLMVDRLIQSCCCSLMVWLKLWVRSPPASHIKSMRRVWYGSLGFSWNPFSQTNYYYDEVSWRTINFSLIDGLVYVWLSCIDGDDMKKVWNGWLRERKHNKYFTDRMKKIDKKCVVRVLHVVETNLYTSWKRSDELGGMAVILLQEETEDVK